MIWGTKKLSEAEIDALYQIHFTQGVGPTVLAHLLHEECHLWDQVQLDDHEAIALQNLGRRLLIRVGRIREDAVIELTRRLVETVPPAPLREEKKR
jgi:hypothetical protein